MCYGERKGRITLAQILSGDESLHKRIYSLIATVAITLPSLAAHADTISTFTVTNGTFRSGATATGTVTIDTTIGTITGIDVTYRRGTTVDEFLGLTDQAEQPANNLYGFNANDGADGDFDFAIETGSLVGYAGGVLCSMDNGVACPVPGEPAAFFATDVIFDNSYLNADILQSGSLVLTSSETDTSVTPEPSSIALLGTGLIGMAGIFRRKLLRHFSR